MPYFMLVLALMCIAVASALGLWWKLKSYGSLALLDFSLTFVVLASVGSWLMDWSLTEALRISAGISGALTTLALLVRVVDRRVVEPRVHRRTASQ